MEMVLQNETRDGTIANTLQRLRTEQERKVDAVLEELVHVVPVVEAVAGEPVLGLDFDAPEVPALHGEVLPISRMAHQQLAERVNVPKRYYDRMVEEAPELWRQTLQTWWNQNQRRRLVRAFRPNGEQGNVRAWLSDRFKVLDNLPFIEAALEATEEVTRGRFLVSQAQVTDSHCYLRLVTERRQVSSVGEELQQGIAITNSEVGSGKVKVQPFAVVLSCRNGMVSTRDYGQVHLGGELDAGLLSEDTIRRRAAAVWGEVRDFVQAALSEEHLHSFVELVDQKASAAIAAPAREAVANVVREFGLGGSTGSRVLERYMRSSGNEGDSQWGLVQAVTYEAHESESFQEQVELEEVGGRLLEMESRKLDSLVNRKLGQKELEAALRN